MKQGVTSRDILKRNHPQLSEIVRPVHKCADCGMPMGAYFSFPDGAEICASCWSGRIVRRERAAREAQAS